MPQGESALDACGQLFRHIPVPTILFAGGSTRVLAANKAAEALFGCSSGELVGRDLASWLPSMFEHEVSRGGMSPITMACDGRLLSLRIVRDVTNQGNWALMAEDLTEVQDLRAALQENTRRIEQFVMTMPLPAWVMDSEGGFTLQNEHCSELPVCQQSCAQLSCSEGRVAVQGCGVQPDKVGTAKSWFDLHQQVLKTGRPDAVCLDVGACGVWRVMLFPLHTGETFFVGGVAVDISAAERERARTEGYMAQLRQFAREFQNIREEERAEVARNIHDHLGQEITVLRLALHRLHHEMASVDSNVPHGWVLQLNGLVGQVDEVMKSAKRIAYELRPDVLRAQGLAAASSGLVIEFCKRIGVRGNIEVAEQWTDPEPGLALHLYRSLQEMLNNMAKHAKASSFFVRLGFENNIYRLEVMDNGVGFPAHVLSQLNQLGQGTQGHLGLRGFFERAAIYGGEVTIITRPEIRGSSVRLALPDGLALQSHATGESPCRA